MVVLIGLLAYGYLTFTKQKNALETELRTTQSTLAEREEEITNLNANIEMIKQELAASNENGSELLNMLTAEKDKNSVFEDQISDITGTVGKLDKLSKTDPQLLQKYSKVYFLNENYMPGLVLKISKAFLADPTTPEFIHEKVAPYLTDLLDDAKDDGVDLRIVSAYRSFDEQESLKNIYAVQYGTGANAFSADQGYSEHQLGTTVDFTTPEIGDSLTGFDTTSAYTWLRKNAHMYGFILSYPQGNAYYVFEPWHWRFVGKDLARDLHRDGKYFYDLDQRTIDTYLISLFD